MGHNPQKRKYRPMVYYCIWDDDKHFCFCNKSTNPVVSLRHHFHRANNPNRSDYNSDFYTWLRSRPQEDFIVTFFTEVPKCINKRAHLITLSPDAILPQVVSYEELYRQLCEEKGIKNDSKK